MKEVLFSDAVGTTVGSLTGTSTVTTFVESASGVEAGGRTGLTALTCGLLFLACIFIAPIAAVIPAAATSSALIYVGILMVAGLKNVHFDNMSEVASGRADADCNAHLRLDRPCNRYRTDLLYRYQGIHPASSRKFRC